MLFEGRAAEDAARRDRAAGRYLKAVRGLYEGMGSSKYGVLPDMAKPLAARSGLASASRPTKLASVSRGRGVGPGLGSREKPRTVAEIAHATSQFEGRMPSKRAHIADPVGPIIAKCRVLMTPALAAAERCHGWYSGPNALALPARGSRGSDVHSAPTAGLIAFRAFRARPRRNLGAGQRAALC
jgi:hypothetical protein